MSKNNSQQRLIAIASAIVIALLGVAIYLLVNNINQGKTLEAQKVKLEETIQLRDSLENQFNGAILELDDMKGTNEELNEIIEQQKSELTTQKNKIAGLISNKRRLNEAREEIKNLTSQVEGYITQISQLQGEKDMLAAEVSTLNSDLTTERAAKTELETVRATLVSEKEGLETQRAALASKVEVGSSIKTTSVLVTSWKRKKSGKLSDTKYARKTDVLNVCMNLSRNLVVEPGDETFQLVMMTPEGTPITGGTRSGEFVSKEDGKNIRYTFEVKNKYDNKAKEVCLEYEPGDDVLTKGIYTVNIYNKGFFAGTGTFKLK